MTNSVEAVTYTSYTLAMYDVSHKLYSSILQNSN